MRLHDPLGVRPGKVHSATKSTLQVVLSKVPGALSEKLSYATVFLSLEKQADLSSDRSVFLWPYTMAIANLLSVMF